MKTFGNILWVLCGGGLLALLWFLAGLLCFITLVGIPLGIQCMKFADFILWPFGRRIAPSGNVGSFLLNLLWIVFFGWELALTTLGIGLIQCLTLIGIPFGVQTLKFAQLALAPFGTQILPAP